MKEPSREILKRLGAGESIELVCRSAGMSRAEFDQWWLHELHRRVAPMGDRRQAAVHSQVEIARDRWGIPHILADNEYDLYYGFGYAIAQDRLFQLDYLRRKGAGRLAEVLGPPGLELDLLARTVGLPRIAQAEWQTLPAQTCQVLEAFSCGINTLINETRGLLPIEFDLLDYEPEPWSPVDSLVIECEFRWYLTGRFPVIVMPELAKRQLPDEVLVQAFLTRESDADSIIPPNSYSLARSGLETIGPEFRASHLGPTTASSEGTLQAGHSAAIEPATRPGREVSDTQFGTGSNNWVVAGRRCVTGKPLLASDPHIAIEAVSCWYEVHLCGAKTNVAGMAYAGIPAVMFGRNERVAWGCTNNICSQRDLYQEKTDHTRPGAFLFDGSWEQERTLDEVIQVRGAEPIRTTIRFSRNGPIVNAILPGAARQSEPVSLKWLGAYGGGWLTALLAMNRARSADDFREATRSWIVPTWNLVFADLDGHIGYQMTGRIPVRGVNERGYRPGWLRAHQWEGVIPFDAMPHSLDPESGWAITANHRPAPDDFPYPLAGTWTDDLRARRVRELIEGNSLLSRDDFALMHQDSLSLRAVRLVPQLLDVLTAENDERVRVAVRELRAWDCRYEPDRVGASIFDVFFNHWIEEVARARFEGEVAALMLNGISGLAATLLSDDPTGWFAAGVREDSIRQCFHTALDYLTNRLGPEIASWTWSKLHTLPLRHVLSTRGELNRLLDHGGLPCPGTGTTVCNTWPNPDYTARSGAGYRMIADLSSSPPVLWAVDAQSQSGHAGSPHYSDQLVEWLAGRYHEIHLDRQAAVNSAATSRVLSR